MNEVTQSLIFPKGELEERWRFRRLLERLVILDSSEAIFDHLDAKVLRDIFEIENKGTTLDATAVSNILYAGGFTKIETGSYAEVQGDINLTTFNALQMDSKVLLVHRMLENNPRANVCRKMLIANKHGQEVKIDEISNEVAIGGSIDWIRVWLQYFTISPFNENLSVVNSVEWKTDKRDSLTTLFMYYCNVMQYYGRKAVNRSQFKKYLEKLGVVFKKGYVQKISGVMYADKVWIPNTTEDQQRSLDLGYAIIPYTEDIVYTPFGKKRLDKLLDQREIIYRRLGYAESQEAPIKTIPPKVTRETVVPRRKTKVREDVAVQTEERIETTTEDMVGYSGGNEQEVEEVKVQATEISDTERTSEDVVAAAINPNGNEDVYDEEDTTEIVEPVKHKSTASKPRAFIDYDPLDTADSAAFLNRTRDTGDEVEYNRESGDSEDTWEDDGDDTVTVETVLTALRVANNIQPITVASLDYWLNRMSTSLAELQVTAEELISMI